MSCVQASERKMPPFREFVGDAVGWRGREGGGETHCQGPGRSNARRIEGAGVAHDRERLTPHPGADAARVRSSGH